MTAKTYPTCEKCYCTHSPDEPCPVIKGFTRDPNYDPENETPLVTITTRPTADGKIVIIRFHQ